MLILLELIQLIFYLLYCYVEIVVRWFIPVTEKDVAGKLALITGAGHGIGRELALQLSGLGVRLVLWDINKENNDQTANDVRERGGTAITYVCDVINKDHVRDVATRVKREVGDVDIVINNAGVLHGGALMKLSESDIQRTMDINIMAYIWICRHFLPSMIARNDGHVINVASMAAKGGTAYLTDYTASKHAVAGFTDALADEMLVEGHVGIQFTTVFPMFVNTGLLEKKRERFNDSWLTAQEVATAIIHGARTNQKSVYIPNSLNLMLRIQLLFPEKFQQRLKKFFDFGIEPQYVQQKRQ